MKMKPLPTTLLAANSKNAEQALLFAKDSGSPTALSLEKSYSLQKAKSTLRE